MTIARKRRNDIEAECKRILREIARPRKKREENWEERGEWKRGKEDKVETRRDRRIVESGWKRVKKVGKRRRREGRETRENVRIRAASNPCLPLVSSCFSLAVEAAWGVEAICIAMNATNHPASTPEKPPSPSFQPLCEAAQPDPLPWVLNLRQILVLTDLWSFQIIENRALNAPSISRT